ncbi:MAG: response regulator [Anaerolineae bacterium]|nr:response regulator [Anaerolineae bacterium]
MTDESVYLCVEDDEMNRLAVKAVFNRLMGVNRLVVFDDSTDFISRVKALEERPTVFLLDVHVKPHDGFEMLKMLRGDPDFRNARVIAFTASVMNEEVERLRASGFDSAIGKPINLSVFPSLIERIVRGESIWYIT